MKIKASWKSLPFIFYDTFQSGVGAVLFLIFIGLSLIPDGAMLSNRDTIENVVKLIGALVVLGDVYLRKKTFSITLDAKHFDYSRRGLINSEHVPLKKKDIDSFKTKRTLLCRLLGLSKVEVNIAASESSPVETLYLTKRTVSLLKNWSTEAVESEEGRIPDIDQVEDNELLVRFSFFRIWFDSQTIPWREQIKNVSTVGIFVVIGVFTFIKTGDIEKATTATTTIMESSTDSSQGVERLKLGGLSEGVSSMVFYENITEKIAALLLLLILGARFLQPFWKKFGYCIEKESDGIALIWGIADKHIVHLKQKNISHYDVSNDLLYHLGWVRLRLFNRYESTAIANIPLMRYEEACRITKALDLPAPTVNLHTKTNGGLLIRAVHSLKALGKSMSQIGFFLVFIPVMDPQATSLTVLSMCLLVLIFMLLHTSPTLLAEVRQQTRHHDGFSESMLWDECPKNAFYWQSEISSSYHTTWRNERRSQHWVGKSKYVEYN